MFVVSEAGEISRLMQLQEAAGLGFRNAVYRAALAGNLAIAEVLPGVVLPPDLLRKPHPVVVILGDDAGISNGPADFPQARRLLRWAGFALVHAAGGETDHYAAIADVARACKNILVIETHTAAEAAWMHLVRRERGIRLRKKRPALSALLIQVPPDAAPHPVARTAA